MSDALRMPTAHETRQRAAAHQFVRLLREWTPEREPRDVEEMAGRLVEMLGVYAGEVECRAKMAEAMVRNYTLNSLLHRHPMEPPPLLHPAYKDDVEAMARAIYDVEVARGDRASSVLIKAFCGLPGVKATPESIRESNDIEPFERCADEWREYAAAALAAYLAAHAPGSPQTTDTLNQGAEK